MKNKIIKNRIKHIYISIFRFNRNIYMYRIYVRNIYVIYM